jgi:flavin-dependent dehydrogenase
VLQDGAVTGCRYRDTAGEERTANAPLVADCTGIASALRLGTPAEWGLDCRVDPFDMVLARREVWRVDERLASKAVEEERLPDRVRVDRAGAAGAYSIEVCHLDTSRGFVDVLVGVKPGPGLPTADERIAEIVDGLGFSTTRLFGDGAPIPIRRALDSFAGDGLMVLGDSACQVIPMHGSGTASALIAADLASKAAMEALQRGQYDRAALWRYCHGFQSTRGAVLAYYYVIRRHSEGLAVRDIDRIIARGILAAEDVRSGLIPEPFRPGPLALAGKLYRGAGEIRLLLGFALAGITATRVMRHYRNYPRTYSPAALRKWSAGVPVIR